MNIKNKWVQNNWFEFRMIGLFFLGISVTIIGFYIAFEIATRKKKEEKKEWKWYDME